MTKHPVPRRVFTTTVTAAALVAASAAVSLPAQAASTCALSHGPGGSTCLNVNWTGVTTTTDGRHVRQQHLQLQGAGSRHAVKRQRVVIHFG